MLTESVWARTVCGSVVGGRLISGESGRQPVDSESAAAQAVSFDQCHSGIAGSGRLPRLHEIWPVIQLVTAFTLPPSQSETDVLGHETLFYSVPSLQ